MSEHKVTVHFERDGLSMRVDDVALAETAEVAADLIEAFRLVRQAYGEVRAAPVSLGGYDGATQFVDDDWAEDSRRIGFK